jgi:hypothetical protein
VTFYANIGTAHANTVSCPTGQTCTAGGTTAGPAKIVAQVVDANGNPATSCSASSPCNLQVRMYLPETGGALGPGAPTCPLLWGSTLVTTSCQYSNSYILVANVQDVVNDPSSVDGSGNQDDPIFTYTILDPGGTYAPTNTTYPDQAITLTPAEVQNQLIAGLTNDGYPTDTQTLSACAAPSNSYPTTGTACPLDNIQSVGIDLKVAKPGAGANGTVENNLIVYRYAQSPGASTAPYQYSATQG